MCADVSFLLGTLLDWYKYMHMHVDLMPSPIKFTTDTSTLRYAKVYGLLQEGVLANKLLAKCLAKDGYVQALFHTGPLAPCIHV